MMDKKSMFLHSPHSLRSFLLHWKRHDKASNLLSSEAMLKPARIHELLGAWMIIQIITHAANKLCISSGGSGEQRENMATW